MSQTRDNINVEQMPEVRLRGGQIVGWAVVVLVVVLVAFFMGYTTGRRAEKRRKVVRGEVMSQLISRLELYNKETREMVAKRRLTESSQARVNVKDLPASRDDTRPVKVVRGRSATKSLAVARAKRGHVIRLRPRAGRTARKARPARKARKSTRTNSRVRKLVARK